MVVKEKRHMSKGIIIVEKSPPNCYKCGLHNYHYCSWTGDCIEDYLNREERPYSCPIKKLPEKKSEIYGLCRKTSSGYLETLGEEIDSVAVGYNQCLEEICKLG